MEPRKPRDLQTREVTSRKRTWQPADILPSPAPQEGYGFRWIRKSTLGQADPTNVSKNFREGWETCQLSAHPELALSVDVDAKNSGIVEVGGLILCKMPTEMIADRDAHFRSHARSQMEAVDTNLMRENDPRMPMFKSSKTQVTFGNGV